MNTTTTDTPPVALTRAALQLWADALTKQTGHEHAIDDSGRDFFRLTRRSARYVVSLAEYRPSVSIVAFVGPASGIVYDARGWSARGRRIGMVDALARKAAA